jgi:hypothetical protein
MAIWSALRPFNENGVPVTNPRKTAQRSVDERVGLQSPIGNRTVESFDTGRLTGPDRNR